jgi:hypothetical protein
MQLFVPAEAKFSHTIAELITKSYGILLKFEGR